MSDEFIDIDELLKTNSGTSAEEYFDSLDDSTIPKEEFIPPDDETPIAVDDTGFVEIDIPAEDLDIEPQDTVVLQTNPVDVGTFDYETAPNVGFYAIDQDGMKQFYMNDEYYSKFFDKEGNLVDIESAEKEGIIESSGDDIYYVNPSVPQGGVEFSRAERTSPIDYDYDRRDAVELVTDMGVDPETPMGRLLVGSTSTGLRGAEFLGNFVDVLFSSPAYIGDAAEAVAEKAYEISKDFGDAFTGGREPETFGNTVMRDVNVLAEYLGGRFGFYQFGAFLKGVGPTREAADLLESQKRVEKALEADLNVSLARFNNREADEAARTLAAKTASENKDLRDQLILAYEDATQTKISAKGDDGHLYIDPQQARAAGLDKLDALAGFSEEGRDALRIDGDSLTVPVLRPEKLDGIVSALKDLKTSHPDVFDNDKNLIDQMLDAAVDVELLPTADLLTTLNKYGVSFEDYTLMALGSGSTAGRILNKFSQVSRARPKSDVEYRKQQKILERENAIRKNIMRIENIRRGGMVSKIATAMRNLQSAVVRAPLEGLGNVVDTALYNGGVSGTGRGFTSLVSPQNWRDSFSHLKYMFDDPKAAEEYVNFIMDRPEFSTQMDRMFNNLNEIQKSTGRGTGTTWDRVLSAGEDFVDTLNVVNRYQEFLIRRGAFLGELRRQTRNEYGIDIFDTINEGKFRDLLNDSSTVKPDGARSFSDIVSSSVERALEITYASQPKVPIFRETASFIVRNGLTVGVPFPRFMFNSLELIGQYGAGAVPGLTRKVTQLVTLDKAGGDLTAEDRLAIGRNVAGLAAIGAAYAYRTSDDAPVDYKMMRTDDGTDLDTTPQFPVRQVLWIGEAIKQHNDGTLLEWLGRDGYRDGIETFLGTNVRVGVGNTIVGEIADFFRAADDPSLEISVGEFVGNLLGDYLSSWAVPLSQLIDAERAFGMRDPEYRELRSEPVMDFWTSAENAAVGKFDMLGITLSPQEEREAPLKYSPITGGRERVAPMSRLLLGTNLYTAPDNDAEYVYSLGVDDYDLAVRTPSPAIRNRHNKLLFEEIMPVIIESTKQLENEELRNYNNSDSLQSQYSEKEYLKPVLSTFLIKQAKEAAKNIKEVAEGETSDYVRAIVGYRRIDKRLRKVAQRKYVELFGDVADVTKLEDVQALTLIGKELENSPYGGK